MEKNEFYNRFTEEKSNGYLHSGINNSHSYSANWRFSGEIVQDACCDTLSEGRIIASNPHIMPYFRDKEKEGSVIDWALLEGN